MTRVPEPPSPPTTRQASPDSDPVPAGFAPPQARPLVLDDVLDRDPGGRQQIPTAPAFTGENLHFTATGGSARIDPATGVLSVPALGTADGGRIRVQARNAAGTADLLLRVSVEDDAPSAPTRASRTVSADGVTFTFDRAAPVGHFVLGAAGQGDPFVVGPVRLLGYDPAPGRIGNRDINGAMHNPACGRRSGFDGGAGERTYSAELNAGLRLPLDLEPGDSLVVTVSNPVASKIREIANRFVVLTVLAEPPPADSFRPPYSGPDKPLWRFADLRLHRLGNLAVTGRPPARADLEARFARFSFDISPDWNRDAYTSPQHASLYGRDLCGDESSPYLWVNSSRPMADRLPLLAGLVQRGIDRYGVFNSAFEQDILPWQPDGGHNSGRKFSIMFAGLMLGDEDMVHVVRRFRTAGRGSFQEDGMTFHVTQEIIDISNGPDWAPPYAEDDRYPKQPYSQGMLGIPDWRGKRDDTHTNAAWTGHPYRIAGNHNTQHAQVLCALALGLREAWDHEAYFDYHMRYAEIMRGRDDPWRFQGGTQALYNPVTGARRQEPWEGWQIHWRDTWAWQMFDRHIRDHYRFPWA